MLPAQSLLTALIAFYDGASRGGDPGASSVLDRAVVELRRCGDPARDAPRELSVACLLPPALDRMDLALSPLAAALRAAAPLFHWRQNANYNATNMGAAFMAGYGYVEFAGPTDALYRAEAIRVGLLALGPRLHYPPHAHPAEEVYHPLTSGSEWRRGDGPWRPVAPGMAIHHPSMMVHETRSGPTALLALYCWIGDTKTGARLTR